MFLSIVIPVYNTKVSYLKECFDSLKLVCLERENYEVIVVDDGSTDQETVDYLQEMSKRGWFHLIVKSNGGLGAARNTGINKAKGDYIFPLDSDDKIHKNFNVFLNKLRVFPEVDILYGNLRVFGDLNEVIKYEEFNRFKLYYKENTIQACSFFKKKVWESVNGYNEEFKTLEDYDFWVRVSLLNFKFQYLNDSSYEYRKILDGVSLIQKTHHLIKEYQYRLRKNIPISNDKFNQFFLESIKTNCVRNLFKLFGYYYLNIGNVDSVFDFFIVQCKEKIVEEFSLEIVDKELIDYLDMRFMNKPRILIGILLYLSSPKWYRFLVSKGLFSYKTKFV